MAETEKVQHLPGASKEKLFLAKSRISPLQFGLGFAGIAPMETSLGMQGPSLNAAQKKQLHKKRVLSRGGLPAKTLVKLGIGWALFIIMAFFYAMLPLASLGMLPFLFFGCVCLLSSLHDEAGLNGDGK